MHNELQLPTLQQRRDCHLATECYKAVKNTDAGLKYMFKRLDNTEGRVTRLVVAQGMEVPGLRTSQGRKSFAYRGLTCWKQLDIGLKNADSVNSFKSRYMKQLLRDVNHPG